MLRSCPGRYGLAESIHSAIHDTYSTLLSYCIMQVGQEKLKDPSFQHGGPRER